MHRGGGATADAACAFQIERVWHSLVRSSKERRALEPRFGTSGLRGLVSELTDALCARHANAFLRSLGDPPGLIVARDLRPSSPRIAAAVAGAGLARAIAVIDLGALPTPALALAAAARGWPAVMVTGSHIADDRNGLKFFTAQGEITKAEERAIVAQLRAAAPSSPFHSRATAPGREARKAYLARYVHFFGPDALRGMRIGLYEQSSVGRDLLAQAVTALGGTVVRFGRARTFMPLDTEALDARLIARLQDRASTLSVDAIISADGDADRPLVTDAQGAVVAGDLLGTLAAQALGADGVAVPVTANGLIEATGWFGRVLRTRVGSPHVIDGIGKLRAECARPVGFEPNGGFVLGFTARRGGRSLPPLLTRDALLPILAVLALARDRPGGVGALVRGLPPRRTATGRLALVPAARGAALVRTLSRDLDRRAAFFLPFGTEIAADRTDGLRLAFAGGLVLHLRPSGNAPEFRLYAEAGSSEAALAALDLLTGRAAAALRRD